MDAAFSDYSLIISFGLFDALIYVQLKLATLTVNWPDNAEIARGTH